MTLCSNCPFKREAEVLENVCWEYDCFLDFALSQGWCNDKTEYEKLKAEDEGVEND